MGFIDDIYDNKNFIGKFFFILSVLILVYLFIIPANHLVIHIDEHFTLGLIQLPFADAWKLIISEVHPPLYYMLLMGGLKLLNMLNISYNITFACKMMSLLSYVLLMIICLTKIRKQHGMFTAGLFMFSLATMSSIFVEFITVRMYGWAILFLILTFLYYCDILEESNRKSWILFTLFAILSAYTSYFLLISIALMYLSYIIYIYLNKTLNRSKELRKTLYSIIASIIFYIPWIYTFIMQIIVPKGYNTTIQAFRPETIVNYFTYFILRETSSLTSQLYLKILIAIFFLLLIIIFIKECKKFNVEDTYKIFSGITVYLLTIFLGAIILLFTQKSLTIRYLLPVIVLFWFTISLLIGKMKSRSLFIISLLFIIIFGTLGFMMTTDFFNSHNNEALNEKQVLSNLNNNNNIIIYNNSFHYDCYHHLLNNSIEYSLNDLNLPYNSQSYTVENNLTKILDDNPDKIVCLWKTVRNDQEVVPDGIEYEKVIGRGDVWLINIYKTDIVENNTTVETVENI